MKELERIIDTIKGEARLKDANKVSEVIRTVYALLDGDSLNLVDDHAERSSMQHEQDKIVLHIKDLATSIITWRAPIAEGVAIQLLTQKLSTNGETLDLDEHEPEHGPRKPRPEAPVRPKDSPEANKTFERSGAPPPEPEPPPAPPNPCPTPTPMPKAEAPPTISKPSLPPPESTTPIQERERKLSTIDGLPISDLYKMILKFQRHPLMQHLGATITTALWAGGGVTYAEALSDWNLRGEGIKLHSLDRFTEIYSAKQDFVPSLPLEADMQEEEESIVFCLGTKSKAFEYLGIKATQALWPHHSEERDSVRWNAMTPPVKADTLERFNRYLGEKGEEGTPPPPNPNYQPQTIGGKPKGKRGVGNAAAPETKEKALAVGAVMLYWSHTEPGCKFSADDAWKFWDMMIQKNRVSLLEDCRDILRRMRNEQVDHPLDGSVESLWPEELFDGIEERSVISESNKVLLDHIERDSPHINKLGIIAAQALMVKDSGNIPPDVKAEQIWNAMNKDRRYDLLKRWDAGLRQKREEERSNEPNDLGYSDDRIVLMMQACYGSENFDGPRALKAWASYTPAQQRELADTYAKLKDATKILLVNQQRESTPEEARFNISSKNPLANYLGRKALQRLWALPSSVSKRGGNSGSSPLIDENADKQWRNIDFQEREEVLDRFAAILASEAEDRGEPPTTVGTAKLLADFVGVEAVLDAWVLDKQTSFYTREQAAEHWRTLIPKSKQSALDRFASKLGFDGPTRPGPGSKSEHSKPKDLDVWEVLRRKLGSDAIMQEAHKRDPGEAIDNAQAVGLWYAMTASEQHELLARYALSLDKEKT